MIEDEMEIRLCYMDTREIEGFGRSSFLDKIL
jgi:hypothetical protein